MIYTGGKRKNKKMGKQKNGAGIFYLVASDRPSRRYAVFGKSRFKDELEIPGGKQDPEDISIIHAAERESVEEFGLHPKFHQKLVDFIKKNNYSVSLNYPNGRYVLYMVKIKDFDFEKANAAAGNRLQVFSNLDKQGQDDLHTLVEMREFVPVNMWEDVGGKKCAIRGVPVRGRDCYLMHRNDFIKKMYHLSRHEEIPMFEEPFEFIDFKSLDNDLKR